MKNRYLLITVVITGIIIAVFSACPFVPIIGAGIGSIFGVFIYQRFDKTIKTTPNQGAIIGALSGVLTGIVVASIMFAGADRTGIASGDILILLLLIIATYLVLGAIGGAIGGAIFKPKMAIEKEIPLEKSVVAHSGGVPTNSAKGSKELELVQNFSSLSGSELSSAVEEIAKFLGATLPSQAKEPVVKALIEGRHYDMIAISEAFVDLLPDPFLGKMIANAEWGRGEFGVTSAIRSLRDENLYPNRMSRNDAVRAVEFLRDSAPSIELRSKFDEWYQKNWVLRQ